MEKNLKQIQRYEANLAKSKATEEDSEIAYQLSDHYDNRYQIQPLNGLIRIRLTNKISTSLMTNMMKNKKDQKQNA